MNTLDLSPLYRTLVGFDRISRQIDEGLRLNDASGYPPFNIEQTGEDGFRIELAVAGFREEDLAIEFKPNLLVVVGRKAPVGEEKRQFLHRGIAERGFERRFGLADHVRVAGASLENGLLAIELVRELPEAMKPRRIAISGAEQPAHARKPTLEAVDVAAE
ncbi:MAG: Hsp20 family protein [Hyphomonadaceae bacterium]|nr:Hsp20 family protein [Hyphomonadaceae bacterium]